jgi:hypothetical protein
VFLSSSPLNTCISGDQRGHRKVKISKSYTARQTGIMRAIEISITPAGCTGGNKEGISGKINKHLKVHS